jgi:hypothetical protein
LKLSKTNTLFQIEGNERIYTYQNNRSRLFIGKRVHLTRKNMILLEKWARARHILHDNKFPDLRAAPSIHQNSVFITAHRILNYK